LKNLVLTMHKDQRQLAQWTAGFADADGMFMATIGRNPRKDIEYSMSPSFRVNHTYVGGFMDGDGFICATVQESSKQGNYNMVPIAGAEHKKNDALLKRLMEFCDSIGVDPNVRDVKRERENLRDQFRFEVCGVEPVETFINAIRPHLVVKRAQAEIMVDDILPIMKRGEHNSRRGFLKMMKHVDRMNSHKGGNRGKYNLEYFEDLWGMTLDE